jgi:hypothetical protein
MINHKKIKIKRLIIITLSALIFVMIFLSNQTLKILFNNKIWAHKVNNLERFDEASVKFHGIEFDLMFYSDSNHFDINHPPDSSLNLSLATYFQKQNNNADYHYWIDFKNLNQLNYIKASHVLDSLVNSYELNPDKIIIESINPHLLLPFQQKGYKTSYYVPVDLHKMSEQERTEQIEQISANLALNKELYISFEYKDYPILQKAFPDVKKLCWFTLYGSLNKVSARLLAFKILMDSKVEVMLIPFHEKNKKS